MTRRLVLLMVAVVLATILISLSPSPAAASNGWWVEVTSDVLFIRQGPWVAEPLAAIGGRIRNDRAHSFRQYAQHGEWVKVYGLVEGECVIPGVCGWYEVDQGYMYSGYTIQVPDPPTIEYQCPDGGKCIVVDVAENRLYALDGATIELATYVSTGLGKTPQGEFQIQMKTLVANMVGTMSTTEKDYFIAEVWYQMKFLGLYKIHAAYTHFAYGQRSITNGCVNTTLRDAGWLFTWAAVGTPVFIGSGYSYLEPVKTMDEAITPKSN